MTAWSTASLNAATPVPTPPDGRFFFLGQHRSAFSHRTPTRRLAPSEFSIRTDLAAEEARSLSSLHRTRLENRPRLHPRLCDDRRKHAGDSAWKCETLDNRGSEAGKSDIINCYQPCRLAKLSGYASFSEDNGCAGRFRHLDAAVEVAARPSRCHVR